jgi:signal transduction histidine kinase
VASRAADSRDTPTPARRPDALRYAVAVFAVLAAGTVAWCGRDAVEVIPFMPFYAAVLIASWFGGTGPGAVASILSLPVASYTILEPIGNFHISSRADVVRAGAFVLVALLITAHGELLRRSSEQALASRRDALDAAARARLLARAGNVLGASLDYAETLQHAAELAVPELADWCLVHLLDDADPNRPLRLIAAASLDPAKESLSRELDERFPIRADAPYGPAAVVRSLRPERMSDIPPELLAAAHPSEPEHARILSALQLQSYLCVPLTARGRALGAITLVSGRQGRRHDEDDLRTATELADRAAMAIDNARLFRDVQRAVLLRDDFLSVASHELRTPTTALKLQLQVMQRYLTRGRSIDEGALDGMKRQVDRLIVLMNDLLDVSRIVAGKLQLDPAPVDLKEIVVHTCQQLTDAAALKGSRLALHVDGSVPLRADPARLDQVVSNLVSNAIKYGRGNAIDVTVETTSKGARLVVHDEGIGIDPKDHERVFHRFERAVSPDKYAGFGLGLWIVRHLVEAHGGSVSLESELDHGATFTVQLPSDHFTGGTVGAHVETPAPTMM